MVEKKSKKGSKASPSKSFRETILVLCAHSDDQILGVGGTIAKYVEEGKRVIIAVFSYGEKANPWLKKEVTADIRVKESEKASKALGVEKTIFLGFDEGKFIEQSKEKKFENKLINLIKKYKPVKIFAHSSDDPHPDHNAQAKVILELCEKTKYKGDLLSFDVWNPVKIHRGHPKLYIDISSTFSKKTKALDLFESQLVSILLLKWSIYVRAIRSGFKNHCRYAEVFYKVNYKENYERNK